MTYTFNQGNTRLYRLYRKNQRLRAKIPKKKLKFIKPYAQSCRRGLQSNCDVSGCGEKMPYSLLYNPPKGIIKKIQKQNRQLKKLSVK